MNCCGNNKREQNTKPHRWMMMLCCLLPVMLLVIIIVMSRYQGESVNYLALSILLICPISHMLLMPLMNKLNNRRNDMNKKELK